MKRQLERWIWAGVTSVLGLIIAAIIFSPRVLAQSDRSVDLYMNNLERTFRELLENYVEEVDPEVLYEGAMKGLFESLNDPHSAFFFEDSDLREMSDTTSGEFGGVGMYIEKASFDTDNPAGRKNYVQVVAPIQGTPAYRAGIHGGDYIYAINGESAEGLTVEQVQSLLRGKPGSDVKITFLRGEDLTFDKDITRAKIEIPTVKYDYIDKKTGYLRIITFTPHTAYRVKEALEDFKMKEVDNIIIDLRLNGGGLLSSVLDIADFFFKGGVIVSTETRDPRFNEVKRATRHQIIDKDVKIVVLIDGYSASASEILTGAMKDRGRATIIGTTSYGKASVQTVRNVGDNTYKFTIAKYITPGGFDINGKGIDPDIVVEEPTLDEDEIESYKILIRENRVGLFLEENPEPTDSEISAFIDELFEEGLNLERIYIMKLIKAEQRRNLDDPPVFDLQYDETLIKAVDFLEE